MASYRRSLYRQSGRGSSSHNYKNEIEDHVNHWDRVWITPLVNSPGAPQDSSHISQGYSANSVSILNKVNGSHGTTVNGANGTNGSTANGETTSTITCKVKTWAMYTNHGDYTPLIDGDDLDTLDLVAATATHKARFKVSLPEGKTDIRKPVSKDGAGALTAADIRGAVGGGDAGTNIAGYSVADSSSNKKKEPVPQENATNSSPTAKDEAENTTAPLLENQVSNPPVTQEEPKPAEKDTDVEMKDSDIEKSKTTEEEKPIEEEKPVEEEKLAEAEKPTEEEKPAEAEKPAEEEKTVEEEKPAEAEKIVEEEKPAEPEKIVEDEKPAEAEKPAEEEKTVEEEKPAEVENIVEEEKPAEEEKPVEAEKKEEDTEMKDADAEMTENP